MSRPRIGFAVLRFLEERCGNIESLRNLMRGLRAGGSACSILVPRSTSIIDSFGGFPVHQFTRTARGDWNIFAIGRSLASASREWRDQFDLIQVQLPSPAFVRVAERVRVAFGRPVVASFESAYHTSPRVPWPKRPMTLASFLVRKALNGRFHARLTRFAVDACVVSSRYQRAELHNSGCRTPIHIIPNSTDFLRHVDGPDREESPELVPPGKRTVAYVGHFNYIKGVGHLLRAFDHLSSRHPELHMLLVGSGRGNESALVRRWVATREPGRVTLLEETISVPALLKRIEALVLPYIAPFGHQLFPNMVLEALASGVPIVTSDIPPVNEIIEDGVTGFLARPGSGVALAMKIEEALAHSELLPELKARGRRLCRAEFDYHVAAGRHARLYEDLLDGQA